VLYLHFHRYTHFREDEIRWVQLLTNRAADAIRQATAYTESRDRTRQLTYLQSVVQDLVRSLGENDLLPKIARNALNTLAADVVTIYGYHESEHRFDTPPAIAGRLRRKNKMGTGIGETDAPVLLLAHAEDVFAPEGIADHPSLNRPGNRPKRGGFAIRESIESSAGVLLKIGEETVGTMFINYRRHHRFSAEDRRIAGALASAAAIAIKNQRLLEKLQGDLVTITHQVQGPLAQLCGLLSGLAEECLPDGAAAEDAGGPGSRLFREALQLASALSENVLDLSSGVLNSFAYEASKKISSGAAPIDTATEVRLISERLQTTSSRNDDLAFHYDVPADFPVVHFDKQIFTIVMYNLLHNATKYSDHDTTVSIVFRSEPSRETVSIEVRSLGEPIGEHEKERIFEKFRRGQVVERTGRRHSGVGLGLWVARVLMRAAGGDLSLQLSAAEPRLACFVVEFPRQGEPRDAGGHRRARRKAAQTG
jgi:signal transduction histidine kinase